MSAGLCRAGLILATTMGLFVAAGRASLPQEAPAKRPAWTTSKLKGAPQPPPPYRLVPAFPALKFQKPTCIEEFPGTRRLLVTEIGGKVFSFPAQREVDRADVVIDLAQRLPAALAAQGVSLFDAEFHPRFEENRYLFVCYVHPGDGGQTRVSRFTLDRSDPPRAIADSERVILTWPPGGHNGGCLEFGTDGCLYISTGDGTGPNPPDGLTTGQDISDLLGAILRIDVDRPAAGRAYAIPADNPFVALPEARGEIWAYGLRNPWKFGIDPQKGDIFAADNGWESWEMVHKIVRGGNCGWPVMEGRASLRTEVKVGPTPILPPVKDHPHTEANSVIGGPVYRGKKLSDLAGSFIYGDYIMGTIWAIRSDKDQFYSHRTLVDTDQRIIAFTQTGEGELLVLDYDLTEQVYELLPSDAPDTSASFPRRLSQTGLFASLTPLTPQAGVIPYSVKIERWMDGAAGSRWIAIPGAGQVTLARGGQPPGFPEGTVLVKHLALPGESGRPAIPLETQLLHFEGGTWRPYSYLWDDAGTEAHLVETVGAQRPVLAHHSAAQEQLLDRTWHVSAANECKLCHNGESHYVLGFVPPQLDRPAPSDPAANQLEMLAALGVIGQAPRPMGDDPWRLVDPADTGQDLDARARSYLHVNCAMCHQPGGNAIVSFFLRRDLPFEKLNTNKGTGIGTFGIRDARIIVPGDPYRSLLLYRMAKLGYARMPYIGSRVVDSQGVALVEAWIASLPRAAGETLSPPLAGDSAEAQALRLLAGRAPAPSGQRQAATDQLLRSTEGALALAGLVHRRALAAEDSAGAVAQGAASAKSDIRGLFETFLPESQRRATLGASIDPRVVLRRQGDRNRGRLIFFSDAARCRACHELDDPATSLGPTLREIVKKYPRPEELLEHILEPSKKIEEPLAAFTVLTTDGRSISGLVVERSPEAVVLKTPEKQVVKIPRGEIDAMRRSDKSLMPDRLLSDLTAQEAADLLAYLQSHAPPP
jgi:putative heme-binding domain-containing protein